MPIAESQPRATPGDQTYSTRKVALEDALLDGLSIPLTILRPLAIYGIGSRAPREWWFITRALAGVETIPLAFDGESRFQQSAAANIAELARVAVDHGGSHVLNAVDDEALSVTEIGRILFDALGSPARLATFSGEPRGHVGRTPWSIQRPMIADMRAAHAIGYRSITSFAAEASALCKSLIAAAELDGWEAAFSGLSAYPRAMFDPDAFTGGGA